MHVSGNYNICKVHANWSCMNQNIKLSEITQEISCLNNLRIPFNISFAMSFFHGCCSNNMQRNVKCFWLNLFCLALRSWRVSFLCAMFIYSYSRCCSSSMLWPTSLRWSNGINIIISNGLLSAAASFQSPSSCNGCTAQTTWTHTWPICNHSSMRHGAITIITNQCILIPASLNDNMQRNLVINSQNAKKCAQWLWNFYSNRLCFTCFVNWE